MTVALEKLGLREGCTIQEMISGQAVTLNDGVYTVSLEPSQTVVLGIVNPAREPEETKPSSEETKPETTTPSTGSTVGTTEPDNGGANTGESPVALLSAAGLAVLAAGAALTLRRKQCK